MNWLRRHFPFNAHQTVNILSEFGPLVTMFIVNAAAGIDAGTWALLISTVLAMVIMRMVLGRLPVFPIIASGVTIVFGAMTLVTGDPMWVQIKVTIFNAMFAGFLFGGLAANRDGIFYKMAPVSTGLLVVVGAVWVYMQYLSVPASLMTNSFGVAAIAVGYLVGWGVFRKNFFKYSFEKTFNYTEEGWDRFTYSFAWFFVLTAILNEVVRQSFVDKQMYDVLGFAMNGVNIWILFKIAFIMPLSGVYAWWLTRLMQKYRKPDAEGNVARGVAPAMH